MHTHFLHRAVSLSLAAIVTLAMLGGIDGLAHHEATSAVWARAADAVHLA